MPVVSGTVRAARPLLDDKKRSDIPLTDNKLYFVHLPADVFLRWKPDGNGVQTCGIVFRAIVVRDKGIRGKHRGFLVAVHIAKGKLEGVIRYKIVRLICCKFGKGRGVLWTRSDNGNVL